MIEEENGYSKPWFASRVRVARWWTKEEWQASKAEHPERDVAKDFVFTGIERLEDKARQREMQIVCIFEELGDLHWKAVRAGVAGGDDSNEEAEWFFATAKETCVYRREIGSAKDSLLTVIFRPSPIVSFFTYIARSPSCRHRKVTKPNPFEPWAFMATSSIGPKIYRINTTLAAIVFVFLHYFELFSQTFLWPAEWNISDMNTQWTLFGHRSWTSWRSRVLMQHDGAALELELMTKLKTQSVSHYNDHCQTETLSTCMSSCLKTGRKDG